MDKIYLHYDMDAFFASVEQRDNIELRNIPLVVGYGIVTTASYEARKYGIKSAMPTQEAKRLCPNLKVINVRKGYYASVGKEIQDLILKITKKCEFTSIDEGYVDITDIIKNSKKYNSENETIQKFIKKFKNYIYKNVRLTCSVGIGFNKISAKIASDINKPSGHFVFRDKEHFLEYIFDKELVIIPGIGKKTRELLALFNIKTVLQLYKIEKKELINRFGDNRGEYLYNVIRGLQSSKIDNDRKRQSYGHEITFSQSINDINKLEEELKIQSKKLAKRLDKTSEYAKTITLKIRYANFTTYTKSKTLEVGIRDWEKIFLVAKDSFSGLVKKDEVRLIGIHLSSITKSNIIQLSFDNMRRKNGIL